VGNDTATIQYKRAQETEYVAMPREARIAKTLGSSTQVKSTAGCGGLLDARLSTNRVYY